MFFVSRFCVCGRESVTGRASGRRRRACCAANSFNSLATNPPTNHPTKKTKNTQIKKVVNLERVGFNLKNFDMAIVFKDFSHDVLRIDAIPSKKLDQIKVEEWVLGGV